MGESTLQQNTTCTLTLLGENTYLEHNFSPDFLLNLINTNTSLTFTSQKKLQDLLANNPRLSKVKSSLTHITLLTSLHNDGKRFLWVYNESPSDVHLILPTSVLSLLGHYIIYDVLAQKEVSFIEQTFTFNLPPHELRLFQVI